MDVTSVITRIQVAKQTQIRVGSPVTARVTLFFMGEMSKKLFRQIRKRIRLAKLSDGKCAYCGVQLTWYVGQELRGNVLPHDALTIDHVIPRKQFSRWFRSNGYKPFENQVVACYKCNNSKGDKIYMEQWMPGTGLIKTTTAIQDTWDEQKKLFAEARQ